MESPSRLDAGGAGETCEPHWLYARRVSMYLMVALPLIRPAQALSVARALDVTIDELISGPPINS